LSRTPEQHALTQTGNVTSAHNAQIAQLTQQVTQLTAALQHMHNQQQQRQRYNQTKRGVDRFAETHPRIDEAGFSDVVVQELSAGYGLKQAYQRAQLLRPNGVAAQTRPNGAAQTRTVDRSISGAPSAAPSNGKAPRRAGAQPTNRRDVIAAAIRKANGSL
jgi:TolA-binding protein